MGEQQQLEDHCSQEMTSMHAKIRCQHLPLNRLGIYKQNRLREGRFCVCECVCVNECVCVCVCVCIHYTHISCSVLIWTLTHQHPIRYENILKGVNKNVIDQGRTRQCSHSHPSSKFGRL